MASVRNLLDRYRKTCAVKWELIELDYALSWVLWGIFQTAALQDHLVFKGGTCLKKCYFGDYRFSEDLDFSIRGECPTGEELEQLLKQSLDLIHTEFLKRDYNVELSIQRYTENKPHPENQEAFTVFVKYPWHSDPYRYTKVKIEITRAEIVYLPIQKKKIIHSYEELLEGWVQTYSLEEIIGEKIAALLSFSKKLHEGDAKRSRARDYYDLWRICKSYNESVNPLIIPELVKKKCSRKNINFISHLALFDLFL